MPVAVVILNWNKADLTRHCVNAAQLATLVPALWIVVDNGSARQVDDFGPSVTLIRNGENLGFAGGANVGMRHAFAAGADYVWLLNNDAEPLPGALDALLASARADSGIGLASAVILNADDNDTIECHGGIWSDGGYRTTADPAEYAEWSAGSPDRIWLLGTALLVSRRLVEKIGYLDEKLFAYWEDNDFSRRSAQAGFRNIVVGESVVRHRSGHIAATPAERPPYYYFYMTRNEILLMRKTGDIRRLRPLYWAARRFVRLHFRLASLQAHQRAIRRGIVDGLLGKGGAFRDP